MTVDSPSASTSLVDQLDAALPQTQCTRCGYPACRPYAQALADGQAPLNRCPPGGASGIAKLAALLKQPTLPLDPEFGQEGPRLLAFIDAEYCIGCTKCIVACPVDAIIGGPKWMHTVLPSLCSGCELCVSPCPVDCIQIAPVPTAIWSTDDADAARDRYTARNNRRQRNDELDTMRHIDEAQEKLAQMDREVGASASEQTTTTVPDDADSGSEQKNANAQRKQRIIQAAIDKARQRQAGRR